MGWFDWLRKDASPEGDEPVSPALVREASDYLIRQTDPKLALCNRAHERLAPGITVAIQHIRAGIKLLPEACDGAPENWSQSPELGAFFVSPDDLVQAFSRSEALQALFDANPLLDEAYTVLGTTLIEKKGFGMAMEGEMLVRDVPQTSVSFSNPRIHMVAVDQEGLRKASGRRVFEELAMVALERIEAQREARKQLGDDRILLQARLQMLHGHGTGLDVHEGDQSALQAQLEANSKALAAAGAGIDVLEHEFNVVQGVLEETASLVQITARTMRLTAMNLLVEGPTTEPVREINFVYARAERERPVTRAVLPVRFPRRAMRNTKMSFADASRLAI